MRLLKGFRELRGWFLEVWLTPANSSQSDTLQVKSPILVKQTDWCYILVSNNRTNKKHNCVWMDIKKDFQFHFETGSQDFYMMEYLLPPIILFLGIILFYVFIKKRILRDEKEDLESLKLLQELLDAGTITENEFKKKKNRITSKWWWKSQSLLLIIEGFKPHSPPVHHPH